jgi:hypothetical protein
MSPRSIAALSGPASTTTVLRSEAAPDFFTDTRVDARQGYGAKNAFESCERIIGRRGPPLEDIVAMLTGDNDRVSAIGRLSGASEVPLKLGHRGLHVTQTI